MNRSKRRLWAVVGVVIGGCGGSPEPVGSEALGVGPVVATGVILPPLPQVYPNAAPPGTILLPIEVTASTQTALYPATDADKAEVGVSFGLTTTPRSDGKLLIVGHGLGYRDGHEVGGALVKDGKASVRLGDATTNPSCSWIALENNNAAVHVRAPEKLYGGIGGGFRTVRLTVDLNAFGAACLASAPTSVRFRFNGTDGASSGYRILYFNVLDAAENHLISNPMAFVDPESWTAPAGSNATTGWYHWTHREALTAPTPAGPVAMVASCSDCHAFNGRDLEYYAYSNKSIINRAMFHGLSEDQGKHIAAFIRSNPAQRRGRPWNPPYQPGTHVDAGGGNHEYEVAADREYWAAGAGLGAVLDNEVTDGAVVLNRLLGITCNGAAGCSTVAPGGGVTQTIADAIRGTGLAAGTTNLRRIPVALQLPDWNSWLPEHHPLDMWGTDFWLDAAAFTSAVSYLPTSASSVVRVGDVADDVNDPTDDGKLDVVSASGSTLTILRGDGYGRFTPQPPMMMSGIINSIALGDFDGDHLADIAVTDSTGVTFLLQRPSGFSTGFFAVSGASGIGAGDFDNDGYDDLVVTTTTSNTVKTFRSSGAGVATGGFSQMYSQPLNNIPSNVAVADFDADGRADVAVSMNPPPGAGGDSYVRVFYTNANGAMVAGPLIPVGAGAAGLTAADLDGDGRVDLAVVGEDADNISVIMAAPAGGFAAPVTRTVGDGPRTVAAGDINGDGLVDLVVGNSADGTVSVVRTVESGSGVSFVVQPSMAVGSSPRGVAMADFDGNGTADLVIGHGSAPGVTVRLSTQRPNTAYLDIHDELYVGYPAAALPAQLDRLMNSAQSFVGTGMWPVIPGTLSDGWRGDRGPVIDEAARRGYQHEMVKRDLAQWVAVKYWEMMQEYELEAAGPALHGIDNGEALSWPMIEQSVHPIAPHITTVNSNNFRSRDLIIATNPLFDACSDPGVTCPPQTNARQLPVKGDYDSTAWYHLQLVLNAGARNVNPYNEWAAKPWDIGYAYIHLDDVARAAGQYAGVTGSAVPFESLRYVATMMKAYQMRDNGRGPAQAGWSLRDVSPRLLLSNFEGDADKDELMERLDAHGAGLRLAVTNAFLKVFLEVVNGTDYLPPSHLYGPGERCGGNPQPTATADVVLACDREPTVRATWWRFDPATYKVTLTEPMKASLGAVVPATTVTREAYVPTVLSPAQRLMLGYPATGAIPDIQNEFSSGKLHHADDIYRAIPLFWQMGINHKHLCDLIDWAELQWPGPAGNLNDWSAWRGVTGC